MWLLLSVTEPVMQLKPSKPAGWACAGQMMWNSPCLVDPLRHGSRCGRTLTVCDCKTYLPQSNGQCRIRVGIPC